MRISSEEYKGLLNRVRDILDTHCYVNKKGDTYYIEGVDFAVEDIMQKVVDQLVKVKDVAW